MKVADVSVGTPFGVQSSGCLARRITYHDDDGDEDGDHQTIAMIISVVIIDVMIILKP